MRVPLSLVIAVAVVVIVGSIAGDIVILLLYIINYNIGDAPDLTQRLLCQPRGEHEDTPCQINWR